MQFSPWIPVVVSIVVALLGVGGNLAVVAFFLGKLKAEQAGNQQLVQAFQSFTERTIAALLTRMSSFDNFATESASDRAALTQRLAAVERNTDGLQRLREDFAEHRAEARQHHKRVDSELERVIRAQEGVQRQLGNLMTTGPGRVLELGKVKADEG